MRRTGDDTDAFAGDRAMERFGQACRARGDEARGEFEIGAREGETLTQFRRRREPGDDRFPDMSDPYDPELRIQLRDAGKRVGVPLVDGVYGWALGPSYETPAEVRMFERLGVDAVGMSTVPEVIALRHMGVRAAAVSCITNLAAGLSPTKLDHSEVEATANRTRDRFAALLSGWVRRIGAAPSEGEARR